MYFKCAQDHWEWSNSWTKCTRKTTLHWTCSINHRGFVRMTQMIDMERDSTLSLHYLIISPFLKANWCQKKKKKSGFLQRLHNAMSNDASRYGQKAGEDELHLIFCGTGNFTAAGKKSTIWVKPAANPSFLQPFESWRFACATSQTGMPSAFLWQGSKVKWESLNGSAAVPPQHYLRGWENLLNKNDLP